MGTERYSRWSELAAGLAAELRILNGPSMTVRKTEMHSLLRDVVEFVGRNVVAQTVTPVVGKPQLFRPRIPIKADRVSDASRHDFHIRPVRIHPGDQSMPIVGYADV